MKIKKNTIITVENKKLEFISYLHTYVTFRPVIMSRVAQ